MEKALGLAAEWLGEPCSAAGVGRAAGARGAGLAVPQFPAVSPGRLLGTAHQPLVPRVWLLPSWINVRHTLRCVLR